MNTTLKALAMRDRTCQHLRRFITHLLGPRVVEAPTLGWNSRTPAALGPSALDVRRGTFGVGTFGLGRSALDVRRWDLRRWDLRRWELPRWELRVGLEN